MSSVLVSSPRVALLFVTFGLAGACDGDRTSGDALRRAGNREAPIPIGWEQSANARAQMDAGVGGNGGHSGAGGAGAATPSGQR